MVRITYPTPFLPISSGFIDFPVITSWPIDPSSFPILRLYTHQSHLLILQVPSDISSTIDHIQLYLCELDHILPAQTLSFSPSPDNPTQFQAHLRIDQSSRWLGWLYYRFISHSSWYLDPRGPTPITVYPHTLPTLRVYTFIPRLAGPILTWEKWFQHIQNLGFNAIHLLPLSASGSSLSPYSIRYHFHIPKELRSHLTRRQAIEHLINLAHQYNLQLFFDLVLNHVSTNSPLLRTHPEWFIPNPHHPSYFQPAGYYEGSTFHPWPDVIRYQFHPLVTTHQEALWRLLTDYVLTWSDIASQTGGGIRLDNYHSTDPIFSRYLTNQINSYYPSLIRIGEYFAPFAEVKTRSFTDHLHLLLATPWCYKFVPQLRQYIQTLHQESQNIFYHTPVNSHDTGSPIQEFGSLENLFPRILTTAFLTPGTWGITMGTELGLTEFLSFIGPIQPLPLSPHPDFSILIQRVNQILQLFSPLFFFSNDLIWVDQNHPCILGAIRRHKSAIALILANFDRIHHSLSFSKDLIPPQKPDLTLCAPPTFPLPNLSHSSVSLPPNSAYLWLWETPS